MAPNAQKNPWWSSEISHSVSISTQRLGSPFPHFWCSTQCMKWDLVVIFFSYLLFRPETLEAKAYVISSIIHTVLDTSTGLFIIQGTTAE